ncbi:penicillin-binding transpeptidase domain-containing protein [Intestinimonas massiliensis (ex Afouda et al. 2020)]|uniref:penicillin-binding transpeptidase domain-containing protein n=1 Tax=Intestinimonas massiliensis (ex Afouda et al. 2020) TaxID=1673721 RepID=UPI001031397A|nr:penicillin-binding transpeptidase domain-containing protein [Intestinimonas massiliensis (ex Afouda et al. 2020)]
MAYKKKDRVIRQQPDRKANRTILIRTLILMGIFGVAVFVPLFFRLWQIQVDEYDKYNELVADQQTKDSTVEANRGTIYDSNGVPLALSATVYNVQLSPKEIIQCQKDYQEKVEEAEKNGKDLPDYPEPTAQFIAENLAQILDLEVDDILVRLAKENSLYEMIKWRVDAEESDAVQTFITENHISGIYLMPTSKRYYPKGSLAAQVIGWVNPNVDNTGAYGVEALYEDELSGESGRVVTAKNGVGTEMLYWFEDYYDATDGDDLTLTIDSTIQSYCESILQKGIEQFDVQDGGFCIAMDPSTGEILAWANSPTYDLNDPWTVSDPVLLQYIEDVKSGAYTQEEAYQKALEEGASTQEAYDKAVSTAETDALYAQWRNKAINDTYEPGSTFKSLVLAAALEEGVVSESDHFYCSGSVQVADHVIHCSDRDGHGDQDLAKAVANSCNPAFIAIGQRLGAEKFYDYLERFGLLEPTGIDMQGEPTNDPVSAGLIWSRDYFTSAEGISSLATASFGQRLKITPIQMLTAAASVVNGGHLMKPYVVSQVTDSNGNVVESTQPTEVRQVVSEQTSERCRTILEKVVDGGTGKNARVEGYRIGGKTGSSETGETDHTIVSFLGFAPADDPQVIILLAYDNPKPAFPGAKTTAGGWYISGGNMAAPMAGELLENILDYLGVEKTYSATADVVVPNLSGKTLADATSALKKNNLTVRTVGDGDTVTGQIPAYGASIPGGSEVVLYMGAEVPTDQVQVPNVVGLTLEQAQKKMEDAGLYLKAIGASDYSASTAYEQETAAGTSVNRGTAIEVRFTDSTASGGGGSGL